MLIFWSIEFISSILWSFLHVVDKFYSETIRIACVCVVVEKGWGRVPFPLGCGNFATDWVLFGLVVLVGFFLCVPAVLCVQKCCWKIHTKFNSNLYPQNKIFFFLKKSGRDNYPCCFSVQIADFSSLYFLVWKLLVSQDFEFQLPYLGLWW